MRPLLIALFCLLLTCTTSSAVWSQETIKLSPATKITASPEKEILVPLVVHNNSSSSIDFGFYDLPENSMSVVLKPGEKSGDAATQTSDMLLVVPARAKTRAHTAIDNKSGQTWKFNIAKENKMVLVTISNRTPTSGKSPFKVEIAIK